MARAEQRVIHVAGNAVLDLIVRQAEMASTSTAPERGWGAATHLLDSPVEALLGGCGAAAAYILASLGQRVVLNTNLGNDVFGDVLLKWLTEAGVRVLGKEDGGATAVHIVSLDPSGNRRSVYYTGQKVVWERSLSGDAPDWLLAAGYGSVDAGDLASLANVFARMRERGTRIAFDLSPWFAGRATLDEMAALWSQVDLLIGTEEELAPWHPGPSAQQLAIELSGLGPEWVAVKRGAQGAVFATREGGSGGVAADVASGVNTIGAGDAFNGRLVCGLCRGEDLATAVGAAVALATRAVQRERGALGAME